MTRWNNTESLPKILISVIPKLFLDLHWTSGIRVWELDADNAAIYHPGFILSPSNCGPAQICETGPALSLTNHSLNPRHFSKETSLDPELGIQSNQTDYRLFYIPWVDKKRAQYPSGYQDCRLPWFQEQFWTSHNMTWTWFLHFWSKCLDNRLSVSLSTSFLNLLLVVFHNKWLFINPVSKSQFSPMVRAVVYETWQVAPHPSSTDCLSHLCNWNSNDLDALFTRIS